ncbi:aldehyde ferredoxin oxidoreductase family protein [Candidatus Viridilinea mediisalina]|uniref:Aldehyde:ferredoxin oxidoreductase n=1 Tax=Candidatus Viridilinea mediisalina TaxID=2024553 RepID=A0A2A6RP43_9CHLR|nr:aldehyde ferredoxin oxidoreductase C-terminal domain-containing protein [Candidatus Viridilinea mediisalina]PDW04723.1 aldehyde:ferredoxin oxidoreductase [Candidatus Viridilinea mediisalina]
MALRTLTVDLERGHARQHLPAIVERDYLGGRGAIAWLLWHHLPADTPPMAPENLLIFAAGPLAGTSAFASGGFVVGTRSPLTGAIGYSWAQGHWGAQLRRAGYDVLVVRGQAPDWVYLYIDGDHVRLRSAERLRGLDTVATAAALRAEHGDNTTTICIGSAGEAEAAYASIVAEGRYMAEPAGTGLVMGTKRLKAVAIRGGQPITPPDERRLALALDIIRRRVDTSALAAGIGELGSAHFLGRAVEVGALTEQNGAHGKLDEQIAYARAAFAARPKHSRGCAGCPMPCYFDLPTRSGEGMPVPDLEIVAGFGARCGIKSLEALTTIAQRCLRLGLDPVATSASIAFMMECQDRGLAPSRTLAWGDEQAVLNAIERLGTRQEKRDILSLGVGEMQEVFWGSSAFAPQAKGLALPGLDPRALTGFALALATAPIGGDHRYAMYYDELVDEPPAWLPEQPAAPQSLQHKVVRMIWHERFAAVLDAAGLCRRLGLMGYQVSPGELLALIAASTGVTVSGADMARIGERIVTIERLFARRYADNGGIDELPERWLEEPLAEGRAANFNPPLNAMLAEYYRRHGWNRMGDPTAERLTELGIKG